MGKNAMKAITNGFYVTLALLTAACGGANMESDFEDALKEALHDVAGEFIHPGAIG